MDYKKHFEKFEADIRKKMLDDEAMIESLREVTRKHDELNKQLEILIAGLKENRKIPDDPFFSNEEFMELMNISVRTSQLWRDQGMIGFSQINGKIYFKMSDIQKLLSDNYHKSKKQASKP